MVIKSWESIATLLQVWDAQSRIWKFPKIRGTFLGVPIIKTILFGGLYWGPLILGNYHIFFEVEEVCVF